jgi:polygalacturonase
LDSTYKSNYKVFRNVVTDFGADNTGATDASVAIQNAINGMPSVFRIDYKVLTVNSGSLQWP